MALTLSDIAEFTFEELNEASDISVTFISYWMRGKIGTLNNLLHTNFELTGDSLNFTPDITEEEASILQKMFEIYYYNKLVRTNLGAAANTPVTEISDSGATIRLVNKNEISKVWLGLKRDAENQLKALITAYLSDQSTPLQISGDDVISELGLNENQRSRF